MDEEKEISFLDHLEVLRWHLVRSVAAIILFAVLAFIYKDFVFDKILLAPKNPDFPTKSDMPPELEHIGVLPNPIASNAGIHQASPKLGITKQSQC